MRDRLGAVNHALLSLEALRARAIPVMGLVMVGGPFADNAEIIVRHGNAPVLLRLEWVDPLTPARIEAWAEQVRALA